MEGSSPKGVSIRKRKDHKECSPSCSNGRVQRVGVGIWTHALVGSKCRLSAFVVAGTFKRSAVSAGRSQCWRLLKVWERRSLLVPSNGSAEPPVQAQRTDSHMLLGE